MVDLQIVHRGSGGAKKSCRREHCARKDGALAIFDVFSYSLLQDPTRDQYVCWATEGGHCDFAPRDDLEVELHKWLRYRFNQRQRVSVERVISGPGIATIYTFLAEKFPGKVCEG